MGRRKPASPRGTPRYVPNSTIRRYERWSIQAAASRFEEAIGAPASNNKRGPAAPVRSETEARKADAAPARRALVWAKRHPMANVLCPDSTPVLCGEPAPENKGHAAKRQLLDPFGKDGGTQAARKADSLPDTIHPIWRHDHSRRERRATCSRAPKTSLTPPRDRECASSPQQHYQLGCRSCEAATTFKSTIPLAAAANGTHGATHRARPSRPLRPRGYAGACSIPASIGRRTRRMR
jgi:hypothetical protein